MKYWIVIVAVFLGCKSHTTSRGGKVPAGGVQAIGGVQEIGRDRDIENLAFTLRFSDCARFGGIGIEDKENDVCEAYKRLLKIAPDSVWVRLSYA